MSWQQQYQPFSGAPSSSGKAYPHPQHQHQQHPQQPQPQPIQHRQPPPAQQQPPQMDPSTYASAAYYQPPPQVAQASRKSSGVGGAGDDGEGGQMESGSSAAGSKESDGNSFEVRRLSFHECGRSWHRWEGRGARSEPHWKEADLVSMTMLLVFSSRRGRSGLSCSLTSFMTRLSLSVYLCRTAVRGCVLKPSPFDGLDGQETDRQRCSYRSCTSHPVQRSSLGTRLGS